MNRESIRALGARVAGGVARRRRAPAERVVARIGELVKEPMRISVAEFSGEFYIDPRSRVLARLLVEGEYEPDSIRSAKSYVSGDVIDIGANVGFYSVALARSSSPASRVVAIEPNTEAAGLLRRNLELNGVAGRVTVLERVCHETAGQEMTLLAIPGRSEFSAVDRISHVAAVGDRQEMTCVTTTVDEVVSQLELAPSFIKIDVEGAERSVLRGATETLRRHRPAVLCEVSDALLRQSGSSWAEFIGEMTNLGYQARSASDPRSPVRPLDADVLFLPSGS